jgi:hypothetical protein
MVMMVIVTINVFENASNRKFSRPEFEHMTISRLVIWLNGLSLLLYESLLRKALTGTGPAELDVFVGRIQASSSD